MKRIMLKLSGEALAGEKKTGFDEDTVRGVALQVKQLVDDGMEVGIVIGGGNTALQDAGLLSEICPKVTVVQNLSDFTGEKKLAEALEGKDYELEPMTVAPEDEPREGIERRIGKRYLREMFINNGYRKYRSEKRWSSRFSPCSYYT